MTAFTIEKGIPAPAPRRGGRQQGAILVSMPWDTMEVGDSVMRTTYAEVRAGQEWARRHFRVFAYRKQADGSGWRVWRVA